jgi:lipopolysaccharide biosynthesis protein
MRALIYVHYDRDGIVDPHVEYALAQYRPHVDHMVFVSPSVRELTPKQKGLVDDFVPRENIGYDFGSWRDGLLSLDADRYEEIVFANDSVYGPLWSPGPVLEFGLERNLDFWGMVMSDQTVTPGVASPHVQSWFFAARKKLIQSEAFQSFWQRIEPVGTKREIIQRFEVGLSNSVREAGFQLGAIYEKKEDPWTRFKTAINESSLTDFSRTLRLLRRSVRSNRNPCEGDWESVLGCGVPFVKVSLFRLNPYGRKLERVFHKLNEASDFCTEKMIQHLSRMRDNSTSRRDVKYKSRIA